MKYKVGDKVKIISVGGIIDPNENDWVGQVSKVMGIKDFGHPYLLENGFPAYENELELVTEAPPKAITMTLELTGKDGILYDAEFVDISSELFRSYLFPAASHDTGMSVFGSKVFETLSDAHIVRVDNPKWLYVAPSGSHRIIDKTGRHHYIPTGWKHLKWMNKQGGNL